jgi:hypothetical protein
LPADYSTLYELAKLSDEEIDQAVAEGKIHPDTTRKQAAALGKSSEKIRSPNQNPAKPKPLLVDVILGEIEERIDVLTKAVRQDQIRIDLTEFKQRVLSPAGGLATLLEEQPQSMH